MDRFRSRRPSLRAQVEAWLLDQGRMWMMQELRRGRSGHRTRTVAVRVGSVQRVRWWVDDNRRSERRLRDDGRLDRDWLSHDRLRRWTVRLIEACRKGKVSEAVSLNVLTAEGNGSGNSPVYALDRVHRLAGRRWEVDEQRRG